MSRPMPELIPPQEASTRWRSFKRDILEPVVEKLCSDDRLPPFVQKIKTIYRGQETKIQNLIDHPLKENQDTILIYDRETVPFLHPTKGKSVPNSTAAVEVLQELVSEDYEEEVPRRLGYGLSDYGIFTDTDSYGLTIEGLNYSSSAMERIKREHASIANFVDPSGELPGASWILGEITAEELASEGRLMIPFMHGLHHILNPKVLDASFDILRQSMEEYNQIKECGLFPYLRFQAYSPTQSRNKISLATVMPGMVFVHQPVIRYGSELGYHIQGNSWGRATGEAYQSLYESLIMAATRTPEGETLSNSYMDNGFAILSQIQSILGEETWVNLCAYRREARIKRFSELVEEKMAEVETTRSSLTRLLSEVNSAKQGLVAAESSEDDSDRYRNEYARLLDHPDIESVSMESDPSQEDEFKINVRTHMIWSDGDEDVESSEGSSEIETYRGMMIPLGEYKITIFSPGYSDNPTNRTILIENVDPPVTNVHAPHVQGSHSCFGTIEPDIPRLMEEYRFSSLINLLLEWIRHADIDDGYGRNLREWRDRMISKEAYNRDYGS